MGRGPKGQKSKSQQSEFRASELKIEAKEAKRMKAEKIGNPHKF